MQDLDNVLQAQERITAMADELHRARDAATLLDGAQRETQTVIEAAEAVVEHAGEFANEGTAIIHRLQAMNLEHRLGEISRESAETQELMDRQLDRLNEALENLRERNDEIMEASGSLQTRLNAAHEQTQYQVKSSAEATQKTVRNTVQSLSGTLAEFLKNIPEHFQQVHQRQQRQLEKAAQEQQLAKKRHQTLLWVTAANAVLFLALLATTLLL